MNCIDCRYNLLKDGHYNCTYEEGECIKINVLEKENADLKKGLSVLNASNSFNKEQLTKAKELLKRFSAFVNNEIEYDPEHSQEHTDSWNKLCEQKVTETGQVLKMTKDEMKNRISMALKDPILQQGFEIICNNLSELEEKISVLLSCKNCPENKGGLICKKEYEDKCLAQKIQYIKELQQENAELGL